MKKSVLFFLGLATIGLTYGQEKSNNLQKKLEINAKENQIKLSNFIEKNFPIGIHWIGLQTVQILSFFELQLLQHTFTYRLHSTFKTFTKLSGIHGIFNFFISSTVIDQYTSTVHDNFLTKFKFNMGVNGTESSELECWWHQLEWQRFKKSSDTLLSILSARPQISL